MKRMWSKEELEKMIQQGGGGVVTASDIDSEEATAGQVLQADGNGGATWEDAGGKLYVHNICAKFGTSNVETLTCIIISSNSTPFTSETFISHLESNNFTENTRLLPVMGKKANIVFNGIYYIARTTTLYYVGMTIDSNGYAEAPLGGIPTSFTSFVDTIYQIYYAIGYTYLTQRAYRVKGGTIIEFQDKEMSVQKKYKSIYDSNIETRQGVKLLSGEFFIWG